MGTEDWLKKMSYGQLVYARSVADRLIAKMESEERVKLWVISDGSLNHAAFPEADIQRAKDKLVELIQSGEMLDVRNDLYRFDIQLIPYRESEVAEMLALNTQ